MTSNNQWKLTELASTQGGFFTASQAKQCGIANTNHSYHVKSGQWQRWQRGIYRLTALPLPVNPDLHALTLYLRGRDQELQGVFGLETAASLYELGDFMPSKAQIVVSPDFERSNVPKNIVLLRSHVSKSEWQWFNGLPVTTPLRTIVDLVDSGGIETEAIKVAFLTARNRGEITSANIANYTEGVSPAVARLLAEWEGDYGKIRKS